MPTTTTNWSWNEDKTFESAIANHELAGDEFDWDLIASIVSTKTKEEVKRHYEVLVEDIAAIEAGNVPIPRYLAEEAVKEKENRGGFSKAELERRKGTPWTEEEHRLFLQGLDKYGKGDWRSISRNFVVTRTPTQVASHAQKFFIRQNSKNKDRRRISIHDVTTVNGGDASSSTKGSITEQPNGNPSTLAGSPSLSSSSSSSSSVMHGVEMYGHHPMGHQAIGIPVTLSHGHHAPYVMPHAYQLPPSTMHQ